MPPITAFLRCPAAVGLQRMLDVVGVLTGEVRVLGHDADTVVAVAGDAGLAGLRRSADRAPGGLEFLAAQVGGDVLHVLRGQRGRPGRASSGAADPGSRIPSAPRPCRRCAARRAWARGRSGTSSGSSGCRGSPGRCSRAWRRVPRRRPQQRPARRASRWSGPRRARPISRSCHTPCGGRPPQGRRGGMLIKSVSGVEWRRRTEAPPGCHRLQGPAARSRVLRSQPCRFEAVLLAGLLAVATLPVATALADEPARGRSACPDRARSRRSPTWRT